MVRNEYIFSDPNTTNQKIYIDYVNFKYWFSLIIKISQNTLPINDDLRKYINIRQPRP